ncbi:hypothetical protein O0L34_g18638 [Tuta absoluta]|nr:hypothetical protein O0L34_g18638 [Tuta absoluta]
MVATNFTFDWRMATRCKEHICTHGYAYDKFYEVFEGDGIHSNNESVFEMHLAILASSNGHILLSNTPAPEPNEEVYEIVVGGGGNKFTELRRNLRRNAKASAKTMGILSAIEFRAFYIKISDSGYIEFGREGDPLPVLSYNDLNPINVKFFSFAAWNGVEAKFLYDCPPPSAYNSTDNKIPDSKMVEPKLSKTEALKRILIMGRNPELPPEKTIDIDICYKITSVHYDSYTTKLTVGLAMVAEWTDRRLAWNPDKFNGTKILKFRQGEIWTPTFYVYNADDKGMLLNKNTELITMTKHGQATLHYQTSVGTWCGVHPTKGSSRERWPNEVFDCLVIIGAWQPHERFVLHELDKNKLKVFADIDQVIVNNWDFKPYSSIVNISALRSVIQEDKEIHESDQLLIGFEMHRRATAFNIVFYTPLIVLVTFVLLSFWNESLQMSRIWFYCGCSMAVCAGFCFIDYLVPGHDLPNIREFMNILFRDLFQMSRVWFYCGCSMAVCAGFCFIDYLVPGHDLPNIREFMNILFRDLFQMSRVWFYCGCSMAVCAGFCFIDYLVPGHDLPNIREFMNILFRDLFQMSRVWFYCGCSMAVCAGFCFIDYLVPGHDLPNIREFMNILFRDLFQMSRVWFYCGCSMAVCAGFCFIDYLVPGHDLPNIREFMNILFRDLFQMSRVWFYCGCSMAVCAGFCFIDYLVPGHDLPNILILYTTVLMGVLVALLIQVLLMLPVVDRLCKTFVMQSVITSKWFRILFFLPAMKTCRNYDSINEAYASQEDDDSGVIVAPRNGNVEEMEAESNKYGEKEEFAEALDKLMFFVYSVTFAVMLAVHY